MTVREPAVAGRFYPADAGTLERMVRSFLADAPAPVTPPPTAVVAPHAGYVYSGPVAGAAYRALEPWTGAVERVALLGPSHQVAFEGMAVPESHGFATPLGVVSVDADACEALLGHSCVRRWERPHLWEHSLEVHVPFLQVLFGSAPLVPIVTGRASPGEVADAIGALLGPGTPVVVSSDLSHYHPYEQARSRDARTAEAVKALDIASLTPDDACGVVALRGLMETARRLGWSARVLDLSNSGDTEGTRDRVVGYGAFGFFGPAPSEAGVD